jgi:radical SAM superfamily enzyme YgiQ (UPF0313 family)
MQGNDPGPLEHHERALLNSGTRVLLILMPFWSPLMPPLGVACLKAHLQSQGYSNVTIADANVEQDLWRHQTRYFDRLRQAIPESARGHFFDLAYEVFRNHLVAALHAPDASKKREVTAALIKENFFISPDLQALADLVAIVDEFYAAAGAYLDGLFVRHQPALVGITAYSVTLGPSLFALRRAKDTIPGVRTVMGGGVFADLLQMASPNFQFFAERTSYIDHIVVGEGEQALAGILSGRFASDKRVIGPKEFREGTVDLQHVPAPDFEGLDLNNYLQLATFSSRSCPFQCSFCSETVQWGQYRRRPAAAIADEIMALKRKYQRRLFLFGDSLLNPVIDELADELVRRDADVYYDAYVRADPEVTDAARVQHWRKSGLYRARLGIESGSSSVLEDMNKQTIVAQISEAIGQLASSGVKTTTYWVVGHPGETESNFQDTLHLLRDNSSSIYEAEGHPFTFYPSGQVASKKWSKESPIQSVYPEEYDELLLARRYHLASAPPREEIFDRVCRFNSLAVSLEIPNPYALWEIHQADTRWSNIQPAAVPPVLTL